MQRGRKSAASLSIIAARLPGERPEPLDDLTDEQAEEWLKIVNRMPVDWFTVETWSVLAQLCRHICFARMIGMELSRFDPRLLHGEAGVDKFDKLTKIHEREGRAISSLATRLRLTPQSRYDVQKAHTAVKNTPIEKPWQLAKTG
jgi:hypothetical protein